MCGIAGIVAPNAVRFEVSLDYMVQALEHRGPDATGTHFFSDSALGHTRLSIVDIESGSQPMLSNGERLGITFNGEIYGYRELREQLVDFRFKTNSDTEVILALYEKYGIDMLDQLPGMFAFAI